MTYSAVPAPWVRAIVRGLVTSALASMLNASGLPALSRIGPRSAGSGISVSSWRDDAAFRSEACTDWMTTSLSVARPSAATSSTRPTRSRLFAVDGGRRPGAGRRGGGAERTATRTRGRGGAVVIGSLRHRERSDAPWASARRWPQPSAPQCPRRSHPRRSRPRCGSPPVWTSPVRMSPVWMSPRGGGRGSRARGRRGGGAAGRLAGGAGVPAVVVLAGSRPARGRGIGRHGARAGATRGSARCSGRPSARCSGRSSGRTRGRCRAVRGSAVRGGGVRAAAGGGAGGAVAIAAFGVPATVTEPSGATTSRAESCTGTMPSSDARCASAGAASIAVTSRRSCSLCSLSVRAAARASCSR